MTIEGTETNQIDVDSPEAQKWFAEAFNATTKGEAVKAEPVPETPPAVAEPIIEEPKVEKVSETAPVTPAPTEPVVAKVEDTTPKKSFNVPDWAKDLPDSVKEHLSKELQDKLYYEQKYKSDVGRQSALQRKLFEARQEIATLRAAVIKPQDPNLAAAAQKDQQTTLKEWNELQQADPNLAKAFDARLDQRDAALRAEQKAQLDATVNPLIQHTAETYEDEQRRLLLDQVPNFVDVVSSPVYSEWLNTKAAPGIRKLAFGSQDHQDALTVLRVYSQEGPQVYNDMVRAGKLPAPPQEPVNTPASVVPQAAVVDTTHADKVAKSREQKVQAAPVIREAPVPVNSAAANLALYKTPGASVDVDDPNMQAAFDEAYRKNLPQRSR